MYTKILVALENGKADDTLVPHIAELARRLGSELLLVHVADGFAARQFHNLKLAESDEMKGDRSYLDGIARRMEAIGIRAQSLLALGNPPNEILKVAREQKCDLIAMTSHGHKLFGDIIFGSTIDKVRHNTQVPLLVVRSGSGTATPWGA